jgi:hypothetical protein
MDDLAVALRRAAARLARARAAAPAEAERLQRQYIAICDAAKAPGADPATCRRRLDEFAATLDSVIAGKSGYKS